MWCCPVKRACSEIAYNIFAVQFRTGTAVGCRVGANAVTRAYLVRPKAGRGSVCVWKGGESTILLHATRGLRAMRRWKAGVVASRPRQLVRGLDKTSMRFRRTAEYTVRRRRAHTLRRRSLVSSPIGGKVGQLPHVRGQAVLRFDPYVG